ncbi:MAG: cellulase family glycosylhydrolase [Fimbriimonadaceae bacterium]|nr:cellulase family glycosylhydrolase [Fimbriimonadaceae bacterium]
MLLSWSLACAGGCRAADEPTWLPASWDHLPRWRGFNLLEKFQRANNKPFVERDFQLIQRLGFNFVRLPLDYRCWIVGGDWERFDEPCLREIDQAIEYGRQYGVHVMLNFHRAPGYTVASPPEAKSLWTDPDAQRVCALHWATFAKRYHGIPNERLSFNLFNEPAGVSAEQYVAVVKPILAAIRREDPQRLIVSDGLQWGQQPAMALLELQVAQATRGYAPGPLTHYQASWVGGSDRYPRPTWPRVLASGLLVDPQKGGMSDEARLPLLVSGPLADVKTLRLTLDTVSGRAKLVVKANGAAVWSREFVCGPGEGEWKTARHLPQWNLYQNVYDKAFDIDLPAGTNRLEVAVDGGDWLTLSKLALLRADGTSDEIALSNDWNKRPAELTYQPAVAGAPFGAKSVEGRDWLQQTAIAPWKAWQQAGGGVIVGEFGAFNKTPHDVVLRWMEDCLANWQAAGWGWALWNFRGSFGIFESGRQDVQYEDYEGLKLDRRMLELISRY